MTPAFREPRAPGFDLLNRRSSYRVLKPFRTIRRAVRGLVEEHCGRAQSREEWSALLVNRREFRPLWRWENRWRPVLDRVRRTSRDYTGFDQHGGVEIAGRQ